MTTGRINQVAIHKIPLRRLRLASLGMPTTLGVKLWSGNPLEAESPSRWCELKPLLHSETIASRKTINGLSLLASLLQEAVTALP